MVLAGVLTSALGIMESRNWFLRFDTPVDSSEHELMRKTSPEKYIEMMKLYPQKPFPRFTFAKKEFERNNVKYPYCYTSKYIPFFPMLVSKGYGMGQIVSTFGNRNYLGTFAMFVFFLALGLFLSTNSELERIFAFLASFVLFWGLLVTKCRAAFLAIFVAVLFMLILIWLYDRNFKWLLNNGRKLFFYTIGFVLLLAMTYLSIIKEPQKTPLPKTELASDAASLASDTSIGEDPRNLKDKLRNMFTLARTVNTYERLWVWQVTVSSITEDIFSAILGKGFGTFKHFFPFLQPKVLSEKNKTTFTSVTFRQAHNEWLQAFSEIGLLGLVLLLWFLSEVFALSRRAIRNSVYSTSEGSLKGDALLLISLLTALFAQFVASVPDFPFHRIETAVYAVVVFAVIAVLAENNLFSDDASENGIEESKVFTLSFGQRIAFSNFLMILAVYFLVYGTLENSRMDADKLVRETASNYPAEWVSRIPEKAKEAIEKLQKAIEMDPVPGDPYLKLARYQILVKEHQDALNSVNKAYVNINFNARSTYFAVDFLKMNVNYVLGNYEQALESAKRMVYLSCGDVRASYIIVMSNILSDIIQKVGLEQDFMREAIAFAITSLKDSLYYIERQLESEPTNENNAQRLQVLHNLYKFSYAVGNFEDTINYTSAFTQTAGIDERQRQEALAFSKAAVAELEGKAVFFGRHSDKQEEKDSLTKKKLSEVSFENSENRDKALSLLKKAENAYKKENLLLALDSLEEAWQLEFSDDKLKLEITSFLNRIGFALSTFSEHLIQTASYTEAAAFIGLLKERPYFAESPQFKQNVLSLEKMLKEKQYKMNNERRIHEN
ncbi:MAG: O-antigen ligase family protein [Candidatus Riflebacteria bacterium]|nr:O-antigen ligase family protein [Candidatus Riflebacteria bacterium]